jgi:hypothetical protein
MSRVDYSRSALHVIQAVKAVGEQDEQVWLDRAMCAIADLYPTSALAFALHHSDVWPRQTRNQVRSDTNPSIRHSIYLDDLVEGGETAAAADGVQVVHEVHLARALAQFTSTLQQLGISAESLVERTALRETPLPAMAVPKRSRIVGSARGQILEEVLTDLDLHELLHNDERSGTVDRKRSILNSEDASLADHEKTAVALINGSPDTPVFLIFGQEDDHTILGEVDHKGQSLRPEAVRTSQRRLDNRLQACTPPAIVKWRDIVAPDGKKLWIACMLGRARGTAVRTSIGSYPYRSGEDTHFASPELITAWQREPAQDDLRSEPAAFATDETTQQEAMREDEGLEQRKAVTALNESIVRFLDAPPAIPTMIRGRSLADWRPVIDPILEHFQPTIDDVVLCGRASNDAGLDRLMRGVRNAFRLEEPRNGMTWIVEAPRLITRLIADQLVVDAYCTEQWQRLSHIGRHPFDSPDGRIPWLLSSEYRHPETLGHDASLAAQLSVELIAKGGAPLRDAGVNDSNLRGSYFGITVGLALAAMARREANPAAASHAAWAAFWPGVWSIFETWEEEPASVEVFATLAGESVSQFCKEITRRLDTIVAAINTTGFFIDVPQRAVASIRRLSTQSAT